MTQESQQQIFEEELHKLICKFIFEMDLTIVSAVGCLRSVEFDILMGKYDGEDEQFEDEIEDEDDGEGWKS